MTTQDDGQDDVPYESQRVPPGRAQDYSGVGESGTPTFTLALHQGDGESVISMRGELDLSSAPPLRELLARMFMEEHPDRLVLDLTDLIYLDSTGLSVFVSAHKRAHASGMEFWLAGPNSSVRRLLKITALDQIFTIVDTTASPDSPEVPVNGSRYVAPAG
jgi:anti-sigma B factor antagonist